MIKADVATNLLKVMREPAEANRMFVVDIMLIDSRMNKKQYMLGAATREELTSMVIDFDVHHKLNLYPSLTGTAKRKAVEFLLRCTSTSYSCIYAFTNEDLSSKDI